MSEKTIHAVLLLNFIMFFSIKLCNSQIQDLEQNNFDPLKHFAIYFYGTYVSSGEIQNDLNSSDPIERAAFTDLNGGFGYGGEFDYKPELFDLEFSFFISSEYLKLDQQGLVYQYFDGENIDYYRAEDKFIIIPAEFGIKWKLPIETNNFKIYIGGEAGIYFGSHTRYADDQVSQTTSIKPGFSLNVLTGADFYFEKNLAANIELKFRDAQFDSDSKYNGATSLPNPFSTRLIVDGVRISFGFKFNF